MLKMYGGLHPRSNVERLYLKHEDSGRGRLTVGNCISDEKNSLGLSARDSIESLSCLQKQN